MIPTLNRLLHPLVISLLVICCSCCFLSPTEAAQPLPPNFHNLTGCLYVTTSKSGQYRVSFPDGLEQQQGTLADVNYDGSSCITKDKAGKLVMTYELSDNNFHSMSLEFDIKSNPKNYNWEMKSAILKINPTNKTPFPETTLEMRPVGGGEIYAPSDYSYSCSALVLVNTVKSGQPTFRITLKRFQVQPFHEPDSRIFAVSRDCSSWLTLPQIMGFLLILFMVFTVFMGAYLLIELGGHSSDLRFSKQGGMLMNQAQLDATKAD